MPAANRPKFEFWHVDYFHGNPQRCYEAGFCHVPNRDHFRSEEEARDCYELHMIGHMIPWPIIRENPDATPLSEDR